MKKCCIATALILLLGSSAYAGVQDDDFGSAVRIIGEHIDVYYKPTVDLDTLLQQLTITPTDEMLSKRKLDRSTPHQELASLIEILFIRAGDILDLHVYNYKGSIKVFATVKELTDFYNKLYHANVPCTGFAFYSVNHKSIYISAENFHREIIGHEIGHAIMSSYFVVQPSVKVQEVLAGYVEYHLRKSN